MVRTLAALDAVRRRFSVLSILLLSTILFCGQNALAATTAIWTGASAVSDNWSDTANWLNNILPPPSATLCNSTRTARSPGQQHVRSRVRRIEYQRPLHIRGRYDHNQQRRTDSRYRIDHHRDNNGLDTDIESSVSVSSAATWNLVSIN